MTRLDEVFEYHAPTSNQIERYKLIRENAKALGQIILDSCPHGREHLIALDKLKECVMWANASIAINECKSALHRSQSCQ